VLVRICRIVVLLFALPLAAQTKHPFTFEDMMKLKRVGEPVPSPDGKWVLFSAVDVDLATNKKTPHIWIVPLASGGSNEKERVLIAEQDGDRPRWAPDGKRFAFISNKDGGSQVWIADFDGAAGSVQGVNKLTSIATEAGGELWSPDGKNILITSDVYPECADEACNAKKLKEAEESKVKALTFDRLLFRHWNAYRAGKRTHIFVVAAPSAPAANGLDRIQGATSLPRDLTPGDYDSPVFSLGGQDNYAFSPDGQEICYTSNHDKVEATSTNNDLWIVPVNGGPARNITADNPASDSTPLYSPDGKYIAYRAQQRPGYESDRFRLMLYDRKTGERKNVTEDFDSWIGTMTWQPSSKAVYFSAEETGDIPLFRAGIDFGVTCVMHGTYDDLNFASDGKTLLLTQMSIRFPNRIVGVNTSAIEELVAKMRAKVPKNVVGGVGTITDVLPGVLSDLNDQMLLQVAMSPLETFWSEGRQSPRLPRQAPELRPRQKISREVPHPRRPAGRLGRRLELSLESRTVRRQRIRGHHDQLPRLDRLRAEVH
jgi:dipeptidyl aminopeptidase/acylaminoacyl peptidase